MHPSGSSIRLTACLAASMLLHAGVLWPAMARIVESPPPAGRDEAAPPAMPPPPPVAIGIERSEVPTTTWIGFEEYREHLARLAEVEQAAFTTAAGGGGAAAAVAAGEMGRPEAGLAAEMPAEVEATQGTPAVPETSSEEPPASAMASAAEPAAESRPEALAAPPPILDLAAAGPTGRDRPSLAEAAAGEAEPAAEFAAAGSAGPRLAPAEPGRELEQVLGRVREMLTTLAAAAPAAGGEAGREERSTPPSSDSADPAPPGDTPAREGVVADRQSPATSRIDVPRDRLRPDRPIAREGLEVRPREPEFWTIERLTALPRNPVVLIRFGRDGVPIEARLLEPTGDARFDQAILASLYRWRASGRKLADLPADGSLDLEFRIVIIGR